jgi:hypothetical protein
VGDIGDRQQVLPPTQRCAALPVKHTTPATNEGCTRSIRISHMLYGDWAAACDIYHRFHALLITRLISPVCAKHTLFVCGVAHTVHRHLSMCSTSGVSICGVSICASRYTGCTAQREVSMHDVSILYGASYMECAARNRRGRRQPMPRRAGYAPSAPP